MKKIADLNNLPLNDAKILQACFFNLLLPILLTTDSILGMLAVNHLFITFKQCNIKQIYCHLMHSISMLSNDQKIQTFIECIFAKASASQSPCRARDIISVHVTFINNTLACALQKVQRAMSKVFACKVQVLELTLVPQYY